jgi:hypothetical protein
VPCPDGGIPARSLAVAMTCRSWGHGNGFAKPHAHDGVAGARKGATTVLTAGGSCARCSWRVPGVTPRTPLAAVGCDTLTCGA